MMRVIIALTVALAGCGWRASPPESQASAVSTADRQHAEISAAFDLALFMGIPDDAFMRIAITKGNADLAHRAYQDAHSELRRLRSRYEEMAMERAMIESEGPAHVEAFRERHRVLNTQIGYTIKSMLYLNDEADRQTRVIMANRRVCMDVLTSFITGLRP